MNYNATIRKLKTVEVSDLAGEKVMVDFDSGNYLLLKGAANDIWDLLQDGTTPEAIVDRLLQEYDVSEADCRQGVEHFLGELQNYGFIALEEG